MTQYLLTVHHDYYQDVPSGREIPELFDAVSKFNESIADKIVFGGGLEPPHTATVVANHDGQTVVTDGPYAETKEAVGGFWVVEVADLDAAIELASRATVACRAPIEVRPFESE